MINLSEVVTDPDLAQTFEVKRRVGGSFTKGRWTEGSLTSLPDYVGVIHPSKANDIITYLPEGVRQNASLTVYSSQELRLNSGLDDGIESDVIVWQGELYEVQFSKKWEQYGYWFAMATQYTPKVEQA